MTKKKIISSKPNVRRRKLQIGEVVWLKDFTAPKVYRGEYFECLLTDQKILKEKGKVIERLGHIKKWKHPIWQEQRFATYFA